MTAGASTVPARRFSSAVERRVDVSVLVPAKDEAENLPLFMQLAAETFAADAVYEAVDAGVTDFFPKGDLSPRRLALRIRFAIRIGRDAAPVDGGFGNAFRGRSRRMRSTRSG